MVESVPIRDNSVKLISAGRSPDPDIQAEAFRLWIENGRSCRIVAEHLGCDRKTIQRWAESERWEQRRVEQASAFMPGKKIETAIALRLAGYNAAIRLQQISFDAIENGTKPDHREVDALVKIAAAGGYSSVGARDPLSGLDTIRNDTKPTEANDLTGKSPDELSRLEDSHRAKRRIVTSEDQRRPPR